MLCNFCKNSPITFRMTHVLILVHVYDKYEYIKFNINKNTILKFVIIDENNKREINVDVINKYNPSSDNTFVIVSKDLICKTIIIEQVPESNKTLKTIIEKCEIIQYSLLNKKIQSLNIIMLQNTFSTTQNAKTTTTSFNKVSQLSKERGIY